jgi:hypothetical protein
MGHERRIGPARATIPCPLPPRTRPKSLITNQSLARSNESLQSVTLPLGKIVFEAGDCHPKRPTNLNNGGGERLAAIRN